MSSLIPVITVVFGLGLIAFCIGVIYAAYEQKDFFPIPIIFMGMIVISSLIWGIVF